MKPEELVKIYGALLTAIAWHTEKKDNCKEIAKTCISHLYRHSNINAALYHYRRIKELEALAEAVNKAYCDSIF